MHAGGVACNVITQMLVIGPGADTRPGSPRAQTWVPSLSAMGLPGACAGKYLISV